MILGLIIHDGTDVVRFPCPYPDLLITSVCFLSAFVVEDGKLGFGLV